MPTRYTLYHNPNCSKSRATLALLEEHNITPTIVEYLRQPPDAATLEHILALLDCSPRDLMRTNETEYLEAGLDDTSHSRAALIAGMIKHPKVIQRPIVVRHDPGGGAAAVIGRPPENVLKLI